MKVFSRRKKWDDNFRPRLAAATLQLSKES